MSEIWKDIKGFDNYRISNYGRVQSCTKIKDYLNCVIIYENIVILNPWDDGRGYKKVSLFKNKKRINKKVHRIVAETFLPNPNNYPIINHKDENPSNNHVDNLEWCTYKYNSNYGTGKIRCAESHKKPIVSIDKDGNVTHYKSIKDAAIKLNCNYSQISNVIYGRRKTFKKCVWKKLDDYLSIQT